MATNTFNSTHHHNRNHNSLRRRRHSIDCPPTAANYSLFLKPTINAPSAARYLSHSAVSSSSTTTTATNPSTSQTAVSLDLLQHHLSSKNFRDADEETRRLLIVLAGDAAQKRGYVFFSEVQFISADDLKAIDELWKKHSDNKYGYSAQKRIWEKSNRDFTRFFIRVGWMKKLESCEVEQYNYRAFPAEFMWGSEDEAPEGHLPLTNALRGTQLLTSILTHPAFDDDERESAVPGGEERESDVKKPLMGSSSRSFKPSYTF